MSVIYVKNQNDILKVFQSRVSMALKMTRDDIFKVIQSHIVDYYNEPVFRNGTSALPMLYDRTHKLLNSLIKTDVVINGNTLSCTVEVDPDYLNYQYMGGASGLDIWLSANEQFHGWSIEGDIRIWDDALAEIGLEPGIKYLMKANLKKCSVDVN